MAHLGSFASQNWSEHLAAIDVARRYPNVYLETSSVVLWRCGSTVYYVEEGREQHIAIPVGGFADSAFPSPTVSVYEETMHSWVVMPKDVESI